MSPSLAARNSDSICRWPLRLSRYKYETRDKPLFDPRFTLSDCPSDFRAGSARPAGSCASFHCSCWASINCVVGITEAATGAAARRAKVSTKSKADRARGPIRAATRRWAERFWKSDTEQLAGVDDALRAIQCEQKPQWLKPDFFCALTARLESCPSRYSRLPDLLRPGPVAPTPYRSVKSFWAKREGERCKVNCIALPQRENLRFIIVRPRAVRAALRPPVRVHR